MHRSLLVAAVGVCGFLAGCSVGSNRPELATLASPAPTTPIVAPTAAPADPTPGGAPSPTPTPEAPASRTDPVDLSTLGFALAPIADGFERPTHITHANDNSGRLFVVEQAGLIWSIRDGQRAPQPFLDIRDRVESSGNEQGLLSVAFHPRFAENRQFFVNYTNRDGDTVVARYRASADGDSADVDSAKTLLTIDQPAANHNGGMIAFGPDGYLYIGMGDGGRADDPWDNAQNRSVLLGKLLRIVVDDASPYAIPANNPFVEQTDSRSEIWAYGLRNPWRFSFDRATGDLYIADVGQNRYEEIHVQSATSNGGENYGWNIMEGDACFNPSSNCNRDDLEMPVAVYSHAAGGCSITGGHVYRGGAFPSINGVYFYADYCSGYIWALRHIDGKWENVRVMETRMNITSFGEDEAGEIYLVDQASGAAYQLVVADQRRAEANK